MGKAWLPLFVRLATRKSAFVACTGVLQTCMLAGNHEKKEPVQQACQHKAQGPTQASAMLLKQKHGAATQCWQVKLPALSTQQNCCGRTSCACPAGSDAGCLHATKAACHGKAAASSLIFGLVLLTTNQPQDAADDCRVQLIGCAEDLSLLAGGRQAWVP